MYTLRRMDGEDVAAVLAIQSEYYTGALVEPAAVIQARLRAFPDTAWVAQDGHGVCAYLAGYCTTQGKITKLGSEFTSCERPDTLYLHDMAVARRAGRHGIGSALARHALETASHLGLPNAALVALPTAVSFWSRLGFQDWQLNEEAQLTRLKAYGAGARYMSRNTDGPILAFDRENYR